MPLGVPSEALPVDLNGLVNSLLRRTHESDVKDTGEDIEHVEFDFLVNGELLRAELGDHVIQKGIPTVSTPL